MGNCSYVCIILIFLLLNSFFNTYIVPNALTAIFLFGSLIVGWKKKSIYKTAFKLIIIGFICSSISCLYYRGQSLIESFQALNWYYGIFFYFFLKAKKVELKTLDKALPILIIILDIAYIVQYHLIDYGINFMHISDSYLNEKAIEGNRLRVVSSGLYSLGIFYGLNNYKETGKYQYVILVILGGYIMLLSGFRQLLVSTGISIIFYMYKTGVKITFKQILGIGAFLFIGYYIYNMPDIQNKLQGMINRNEDQSFGNEDYVRLLQLRYYLYQHFKSPIEWFFGSGLPYYKSSYARYIENSYSYVDWGLLGQSWALGILTVIGFIKFSVTAIKVKVPLKYAYISLWYIFLLSASITNYEFMRNGNFLVHGLVLYMAELAARQQQIDIAEKI